MTWCIALFTTAADAAAIVGDLDEEWLCIATRDGERVARRWYWHQMLRTIAQLAVAPLRESPLPFLLLGALGFGVMLPLSWAVVWFAGQVVVRVPVYQYVPATLFWWTAGMLPLPIVGTMIAIVMGRRAMAGALAVVSAMAVWVAVIDPLLLISRLPSDHLPGWPSTWPTHSPSSRSMRCCFSRPRRSESLFANDGLETGRRRRSRPHSLCHSPRGDRAGRSDCSR
jgi:hypothetical protein